MLACECVVFCAYERDRGRWGERKGGNIDVAGNNKICFGEGG